VCAILGILAGNHRQEVGYMLDSRSARLIGLGKQIADLERARRSLPAGYLWTGDPLIAALQAEKQQLESLVAMPDLAPGGGSEPDSAARKSATPFEADGPPSDGTQATPELAPEPEAAGVAPPEVGTSSQGMQDSRLVGFIRSHGGKICVRGLMRWNCRRYPTRGSAVEALGRLERSGAGRWEEEESGRIFRLHDSQPPAA
jgi:hypothetical protein